MINIKELFEDLPTNILGNQKRLNNDSKIKVFYGLSREGKKRVSFLSSCRPCIIESTKLIDVIQVAESDTVYWTCFDLLDSRAESVFYSLCEDLLVSIEKCIDEITCLKEIKNRFSLWKKLLGKSMVSSFTDEKIKGLFGELYFLYTKMINKYGIVDAIKSWGGPDNDAKDFTINKSWYEVKTLGSSTTYVTISSLTQLDSNHDGDLIAIKVENMSDVYAGELSSVEELVSRILDENSVLDSKELFLSKLDKLEYNPLDEKIKMKFKVQSLTAYEVKENFPRIKTKDIFFPEIDNVTYTLHLKSIEKFKQEV